MDKVQSNMSEQSERPSERPSEQPSERPSEQPSMTALSDAALSSFAAQFASIRTDVCNRLQTLGAEYAMTVQKLVRTCVMTNMQISTLAELHAKNIVKRLQACNASLINFTTSNAMLSLDGIRLLVTFDLSRPGNSILEAKYMEALHLSSQSDVATHILALKNLQMLMLDPIDDTNIVVPFEQLKLAVSEARRELTERRAVLQETIRSRSNTAFDYQPDMSFYTVNYADDLSMIFWDRYTIKEMTAKSYYIEQHCIVEHVISGEVEPERCICLHKPSKNTIASFLADRCACLTALTRPVANVEPAVTSDSQEDVSMQCSFDVKPDAYVQQSFTQADDDELDEIDEDDKFTEEDLAELGLTAADVDPSNVRCSDNI